MLYIVRSTAETFHLGMTLSTTIILPALCVIGTNTSQWIKVFAQNRFVLNTMNILKNTKSCK
jgi:hypothetical protein